MEETTPQRSTGLLRNSDDPLFARLRELLQAQGVDPHEVVLADMFPDDSGMEFGIVVTPDRHVYEFDLHYGHGDLKRQAETAVITDWRDQTERWLNSPSRESIEEAMRLLDRS